jgi:RNA polymerase sigma factor (sigma-70 family)
MMSLDRVRDAQALASDPYEAPLSDNDAELLTEKFGTGWLRGDPGFKLESAVDSFGEYDYTAESAEEVVAEEQEHGILRRAIGYLPERQSEAILLRFGFTSLGDMTQAEAAEFMEISQPALHALEKKAIVNLQKILQAMPEGQELIESRLIEMGLSGHA